MTTQMPLFWKVSVRLAGEASPAVRSSPDRVRSSVEVALHSARGNGIRFRRHAFHLPSTRPWFAASEDEVASILPDADGQGAAVDRPDVGAFPMLPLGRSATGRVVGPPVESGQGRHLAILGETGMGKSSALVAIARKAASLGGVVLLDPLGETARSFCSTLSPSERSRLVCVSPEEKACGINALEGVAGNASDAVLGDRRLNDLVHALRRVRSGRYNDSSYWGPRLEEMLTRALSAAAALPGGSLSDAHTLLATGGRTRQVVPPEAQGAVRELSDRIRDRPEDAEGARRLLYEVVRNSVLLRMLCERTPTLHAKDLVAPGRIAVISGEASRVGESVARYLLAVYLALVWSELLARPSQSKTFVVLDESQWFSHESLAEMLQLARRRNVHVVLATQTVTSLPENVAEAVWTNVSDFVAFRGSPEEARELSRTTHALSVEEILSLPRGHAAVLLGKGSRVDWVRTAGRPPGTDVEPNESPVQPTDLSHEAEANPVTGGRRTPTVQDVLDWILEQGRVVPAGEVVRVSLTELRRSVDPEGRAVRAAGAVLGRVGALRSSGRSAAGPVWVVDRTRIPGPPTETARPTSCGASEAPQPS
jgi:hypothetical protein